MTYYYGLHKTLGHEGRRHRRGFNLLVRLRSIGLVGPRLAVAGTPRQLMAGVFAMLGLTEVWRGRQPESFDRLSDCSCPGTPFLKAAYKFVIALGRGPWLRQFRQHERQHDSLLSYRRWFRALAERLTICFKKFMFLIGRVSGKHRVSMGKPSEARNDISVAGPSLDAAFHIGVPFRERFLPELIEQN